MGRREVGATDGRGFKRSKIQTEPVPCHSGPVPNAGEPTRTRPPSACRTTRRGAPRPCRLAPGLSGALALSLLAFPVASAQAQWKTDDAGLAAARRCQSRAIMSSGLVFAASGALLLRDPDNLGAGLGFTATGVTGIATGIGLRVALRDAPRAETPHERWPVRRCEARTSAIRGSLYLAGVAGLLIRYAVQHVRRGLPIEAWIAAIILTVPAAAVGAALLGLGIRRLRRLGPRPPPEPAMTPLVELPLGGPDGSGRLGIVPLLGPRRLGARGGGAAMSYTGQWP